MRVTGGALRFAPTLPARWRHYQFKIHIRGALLQVRVGPKQAEYTLLRGDALAFTHRGRPVSLTGAAPTATEETR
jgi:alpha,alpha-trehalose phosphorylase